MVLPLIHGTVAFNVHASKGKIAFGHWYRLQAVELVAFPPDAPVAFFEKYDRYLDVVWALDCGTVSTLHALHLFPYCAVIRAVHTMLRTFGRFGKRNIISAFAVRYRRLFGLKLSKQVLTMIPTIQKASVALQLRYHRRSGSLLETRSSDRETDLRCAQQRCNAILALNINTFHW